MRFACFWLAPDLSNSLRCTEKILMQCSNWMVKSTERERDCVPRYEQWTRVSLTRLSSNFTSVWKLIFFNSVLEKWKKNIVISGKEIITSQKCDSAMKQIATWYWVRVMCLINLIIKSPKHGFYGQVPYRFNTIYPVRWSNENAHNTIHTLRSNLGHFKV